MHLCYVDDSGSDNGRTLTGLLVPASGWDELLGCWLRGRAALTADHGIGKHRELKGNGLGKTRGSFCDDDADSARFRSGGRRRQAYLTLLEALAHCSCLQVVTVASATRRLPEVYGCLVTELERWGREHQEQVLVFLDGKELPRDVQDGQAVAKAATEDSVRGAAPFRNVHRALELHERYVVEDPIMQDSRYSQLIQAADVVAYAAFQHLRDLGTPEGVTWSGGSSAWAAEAYQALAPRYLKSPDAVDGIVWREAVDNSSTGNAEAPGQ